MSARGERYTRPAVCSTATDRRAAGLRKQEASSTGSATAGSRSYRRGANVDRVEQFFMLVDRLIERRL
jgi:hypothetical protein